MGNHERMMLDFIKAPALNGPRWLASGGDATLQSLGLSPYHRSKMAHGHPVCETSTAISAEARLTALRDALLSALPKGLYDWLLSCPLLWHEGALAVTHAGADPGSALSRQSAQNLLWGHPDFLTRQRSDGKWVAHGHTITATPTAEYGRISVDTGAYRTGCLTAAVLDADGVKFVSTVSPPVKSPVSLR
jgi:serine/threonine protein phosphatase 1